MNHDAYLEWKPTSRPAPGDWRAPLAPPRRKGLRGAVDALVSRRRRSR